MDTARRAADDEAGSPAAWVRVVVRRAIAIRLFPTGKVNWAAVDASILTVETTPTGHAPRSSSTAVRVVLDSDRNAIAAERSLLAAGTQVTRDPTYDLHQGGRRCVALIVRPASDSNGVWERDL